MKMMMRLAVVVSLALAACGTSDPAPAADAGTGGGKKCNGVTCSAGQVCHATTSVCCSPTSCAGKECGDDGCGNPCGTCGTGTSCDTNTYTCTSCSAENNGDFCARMAQAGKVCGSVTGVDSCTNISRTVDCGACTNGKGCASDNTCTGACVAETDAAFCARLGKNCGPVDQNDNCGTLRHVNCGTCSSGDGDCVNNICSSSCAAESDAAFCARQAGLGKVCGSIKAKDNCDQDRTVDCGTAACTGGQSCNSANTCGTCVPETEAQFCARLALAGKNCGSITDKNNCTQASRTVNCGTTACYAGATCTSNHCNTAPAPANDTCTAPQALATTTLDGSGNGTITVTGDTSNATDNSKSLNGGLGQGPDLVYTLTLDPAKGNKQLTVTMAFTATGQTAVTYLRKGACTTTTATDELKYASGASATFTVKSVPGGTYHLWADGYSSSKGAFTLTVVVADPPVSPCASATPVTTFPATITGTTVGGSNFTQGTCGGGAGNDKLHAFTTPDVRDVTITVTPDSSSATFKPVVYLRKACDSEVSADQLACNYQSVGGSAAKVSMRRLAAGTYYVWVDGGSSSTASNGGYTLTIDAAVPPPSPCGAVNPITSLPATVTGTTVGGSNYTRGTCGGDASNDKLHAFTLSSTQMVRVTVTPDSASATFKPAVYLRKSCDSELSADQIGCKSQYTAGSAVTYTTTAALAAGTYYVWIDGYGTTTSTATSGGYELKIETIAVPANDTCGTGDANVVALTAGAAAVSGDTTAATNDYGATLSTACSSELYSAKGKDVVYSYTPTASGPFKVKVVPTGFDAQLWYNTGTCGDGATCVFGADDGYSGSAETLTINGVAGTKYYLYVDSYSATSTGGAFTIQVTIPVVPTNDTCGTNGANAIPLTLGAAAVSGDTSDATADYGGSMSTVCNTEMSGSAKGKDVVYSYTPAANGNFKVTLTPNGWDASLWYTTGTCGGTGSTCIDGSDNIGKVVETLTINGVAGTTYYLHVDSYYTTTSGPFTIQVTNP